MCPLCSSFREPGYPIETQRFNDLGIVHYVVRYECGTTIEFTRMNNNYVKDNVSVSSTCIKNQKKGSKE
jgi:hypothetical protein